MKPNPINRDHDAAPQSDRPEPAPIFIVGMNGSGTTMLLDCLDNHPHLFGFKRETQVLPFVLASLPRYGDLRSDRSFRRLWEAVLAIPAFRYVNGGRPPALPGDWRETERSAAAVIDRVFMSFARQAGKRRWCEKTPMHALHISRLAQHFPRARFIHIIRDGRACAASFQRRWQYTPELTMYRWKNVVREAARQGRTIGEQRYLELRYEDLTAEPRPWMETVCRFIDEPFVEEILEPSRLRTFTGSQDTRIATRRAAWQEQFDPLLQQHLEHIGGRCLATLGYPTDFPISDHDPAPPLRKFWLYRDYVREGFKRLGKPDAGTRMVASVKQRLTTRY